MRDRPACIDNVQGSGVDVYLSDRLGGFDKNGIPSEKQKVSEFDFDGVYGPSATQAQVITLLLLTAHDHPLSFSCKVCTGTLAALVEWN